MLSKVARSVSKVDYVCFQIHFRKELFKFESICFLQKSNQEQFYIIKKNL